MTASNTIPDRKTAVVVGILFIIATVFSLVSTSLTGPLTGGIFTGQSSNYLSAISAGSNQMLVGVLFLLGGALAVVLIPAMMFPILKKQNEGMALGYLVLRVVEGVTQVADALILLTLLSLSQEFVAAGLPVSSSFQTSGALISAANNWATLFDPIVFGLGALIFYYMLYASRLVPRWLSVWGFLGGALVFAFGLMWMFGNEQLYLALPIAVQEMVLAAWLIVKGFNRQATIYSGATK